MHWRLFSSTVSFDASKSTEFQPAARQAEMTVAVRAVVEVEGHGHG